MGYAWTLLLALDMLGAAIFFNRLDFTISSMAGIVMNVKINPSWQREVDQFKFSKFQLWFLTKLGPLLNKIQTNHCQKAIASDLARASSTSRILNDQILGKPL